MASREDVKRFFGLPIDFSAIELESAPHAEPYFCTPEDAEIIGWGSCGTHFIFIPGDETVYCVEPELGKEGTFVLPVGRNFREFLSYLLYCKCTSPLAQIAGLGEERFRRLLTNNAQSTWPGCEETFRNQAEALTAITDTFGVVPKDPYGPVKAMQADFDPSVLVFSDEYYDVLGLENPRCPEDGEL